MRERVAELAGPTTKRPHICSFAIAAMVTAAVVLVLWWVDPGQMGLPACAFHAVSGLHCPGCGATRATHELLHGRLLLALQDNALWVLALPLALYAAVSETRYLGWGRPLPGNLARRTSFFIVIGVVAVVFGVLRNVPSYPFNLLIPLG